MENLIKQAIISYGADICGIANIDRFNEAPRGFSPIDLFAECKSVIVFGVALPKGITKVDSRLIYGHFNSFICQRVDEISLRGAKTIEEKFKAITVPIPCDAPYDFWDKENMVGKGLISMKHAAVLSGIGEIGKNTLLINNKYGNLLTIGAILTDLDLQSDELSESICIKGCTKCLDNCPVYAIQNGIVNQKLCRTASYSKTERGFDTVECNRCRVVCPVRFGL